MRTPHGDADVSVRATAPGVTLRDLVRLVTGQAVPPVAEVDGRAVDTATPLAEAGLAIGSLIDTTTPDATQQPPMVGLLQVAGPGAGVVRPLTSGRYRIGPGRRLAADELASAPVEVSALELTVGDDGGVEARPGYTWPVRLNGTPITDPRPWHSGMLEVGGRVFAVESPWRASEPGRRIPPDATGIVPFGRPPRGRGEGPRHLVVDALRDAVGARPSLWRQRAGDLAAFVVPFGLGGDPPGPITVDLAGERGVAIVGSAAFTGGLARTLLVELTTLHGPADLDLAIATRPDRVGRWDWAKWLPHLRRDGRPQYITDETHLREWVSQRNARTLQRDGRASVSHLTILVADEPALWSERSAPLATLVSSQPVGLRLLALTDTARRPPSSCTAVVSAHGERHARLIVPERDVDVVDIVPALTEVSTATVVARHLAPLDDDEQPVTAVAFGADERGPASVAALLAPLPATADAIGHAWSSRAPSMAEQMTVPIGLSNGQPVSVELGPGRHLLVTGRGPRAVGDVAFGVVAALAAQFPPDRLSIVHVAVGRRDDAGHGTDQPPADPLDHLDDLPHSAGRYGETGAVAATRLVVRLAKVLGNLDPTDGRVVVVVHGADAVSTGSPGLVEGLVELARSLPALQLVVTGERGRCARVEGACAVRIDVDESGGVRRGSLRIDDARVHRPFAPYAGGPDRPGPDGLLVHPVVHGRPMTPLERRLELLARRDGGADQGVRDFVDALRAAATRLGRFPTGALIPRPLPPLHRSETLLEDRPGDAIPIGLVDLPEQRDATPLWWQPGGRGSMLFVGSPRSGVDAALSTIVLGAGSRYAANDLHLYAVDASSGRRGAVELLPHTGLAVPPERVDQVGALLDWLAGEVERRRQRSAPVDEPEPALLLLVNDLGRLRRAVDHREADRLLAVIAGGGDVAVNLVATAWRPDEAGALLDRIPDRYVGALAERADSERLGVLDPVAVDGQVGRCWSTRTGRMVQLALPPRVLAAEIEAVGAEPATSRPPVNPAAPWTAHGETT